MPDTWCRDANHCISTVRTALIRVHLRNSRSDIIQKKGEHKVRPYYYLPMSFRAKRRISSLFLAGFLTAFGMTKGVFGFRVPGITINH